MRKDNEVKKIVINSIRLGFSVEILYKDGEYAVFSIDGHNLTATLDGIKRQMKEIEP